MMVWGEAMKKKREQVGRVEESLETYTAARWMKRRKPNPNALKEMAKFRKRHAHHRTDGKTVIELIREERGR